MSKSIKKKTIKLKKTGESVLHWIEIALGVVVLLAVAFMTFTQFQILFEMNWRDVETFLELLKTILQLAIGVEIARLLFSYSLETIIELAVFVVARKLLLLEGDFVSLVLGVISLAILFVVRHFFMEDDSKLAKIKGSD